MDSIASELWLAGVAALVISFVILIAAHGRRRTMSVRMVEMVQQQRESDDDPHFLQPNARACTLWRYMNFPKFVSFLIHGVHLTRSTRLGDDWEGSLPAGTANVFGEAQEALRAEIDGKFAADLEGPWKAGYAAAKLRGFVSCWQMAEHESWWMWRVYCDGDFGVAVKTTYGRLCDILPVETDGGHPIKIGLVRYGDYASVSYRPDVDVDAILMSKRVAFKDESEVRVLCDLAGAAKDKGDGFCLGSHTRDLAIEIAVSPFAPNWFVDIVKSTCEAHGLAIPVKASPLARSPSEPFDPNGAASG